MKKIIPFLLAITAVAFTAPTTSAQTGKTEAFVKLATDTASNADTVIVTLTNIGSNVKTLAAVVKRQTGSIGAGSYVLLQGSVDGNEWFDVNTDTLSVSNQATNKKSWVQSATNYRDYRLWYKSAGTQTSTLQVHVLRRPDED